MVSTVSDNGVFLLIILRDDLPGGGVRLGAGLGTEYTAASTQSPSAGTGTYDMTMTESINMKSFAQWFEGNMGEDPSYSEILTSTAENRIASSAISKDVLTYIRERKELTAEYDAPHNSLRPCINTAPKGAADSLI